MKMMTNGYVFICPMFKICTMHNAHTINTIAFMYHPFWLPTTQCLPALSLKFFLKKVILINSDVRCPMSITVLVTVMNVHSMVIYFNFAPYTCQFRAGWNFGKLKRIRKFISIAILCGQSKIFIF